MNRLYKYTVNLLIALDQMVNAICGGSPDETISSRVGRNYPNSLIAKLIDALFFWDRGHCKKHIEPDDREQGAIIK